MLFLMVRVLSAAVMMTILLAPQVQAQPSAALAIPLVVERAAVVDGRLHVVLFNPGSVQAVGWGISATVTYVDGSSERLGASCDAYPELVAPKPISRLVGPGGRTDIRIGAPAKGPEHVAHVTAVTTFAIFENDSAIGDEKLIESYFQRRAVDERVWTEVEKVVADAALISVDALSGIEDIQARLMLIKDAAVQQAPSFHSFQREVATALRVQAGILSSPVGKWARYGGMSSYSCELPKSTGIVGCDRRRVCQGSARGLKGQHMSGVSLC